MTTYYAHIPYRSGPKGSRTYYGKGRSVEQSTRVKAFTPAAVMLLKKLVERPDEPLLGPVAVRAAFYIARPKGAYNKTGLRAGQPQYPTHTQSGDIDKHERCLFDVLQQARWIENDSQIVQTVAEKFYCDPGIESVEVWVTQL